MSDLNRWVPRLTLVVAGSTPSLRWPNIAMSTVTCCRRASSARLTASTSERRPPGSLWGAPAVAALGLVSRWGVKNAGCIPPAVPPTLLGLGALIAALSPASGGWALLGLGAAGLAARRRLSGMGSAGRSDHVGITT